MSIRRRLLVGTWTALVLAASSGLAQTAPPTGTPAPSTGTPAPPSAGTPARPSEPADASRASDVSRQLPGETTVDAPARSREQSEHRLPDMLRTVPGITPR